MDDYLVPILVIALLLGLIVGSFYENRKRILWLKTNEACFKIHTIHSVDVMAGLNETTYGTSVRPMADVSDFKNHVVRIYLGKNGAAPLDNERCSMIDTERWLSFLKQVLLASKPGVSNWMLYVLQEIASHVYAPVSFYFLRRIRLAQCVAISKLTDLKSGSVWVDPRARALGDKYTLKFGCDESTLSIWWFDVFDDQISSFNFPDFVVRIPGNGTHVDPFEPDATDAYLISHDIVAPKNLNDCQTIYMLPSLGTPSRPSSYTSLRDALVEEGNVPVVETDGELCLFIGSQLQPLAEGMIYQTESNLSPLDLRNLKQVPRRRALFRSPNFVTKLVRVPWGPFFGRKFFLYAICVLLVYVRQIIFLKLVLYVGWRYALVSLLLPPLATELCVASALAGGKRCQIVELCLVSLGADLLNWLALLPYTQWWTNGGWTIAIVALKVFLCKLL